MPIDYSKMFFNLSDDELERFIADWVAAVLSKYSGGYDRFAGAGDMGRDIVGYLSTQRMDGPWHNYQCKQYKRALAKGSFLVELGKIFFYSTRVEFSLPEHIYYVAPRGVSRTVQNYISQPKTLQQALLDEWDTTCATSIEKGITHPIDQTLKDAISAFDFSHVEVLDAEKLAKLPNVTPVLVRWFGEDPGQYPPPTVPSDVQSEEETYIDHLIAAYSEHRETIFHNPLEALTDGEYGPHLRDQRARYFEAEAFMRYYRDNTPKGTVEGFKDDVYHGVIDEHRMHHKDALEKVNSVLKHASTLSITGTLGRYAKNAVKQGTCHHLVNDGELSWKP